MAEKKSKIKLPARFIGKRWNNDDEAA
jgi:hypothetical protein